MLERTLSKVVKQASANFSVLMITGPRQVGKTTLLENCMTEDRTYVTLDDLDIRAIAKGDPQLFLQKYPAPILIDEVQYAPELFSAIKMAVDKEKKPGMFWLTGSQKFNLMQNVTESLAGRVAILDLLGFSQAELTNRAHLSEPFLPISAWVEKAKENYSTQKHIMEVYHDIWNGSFPKVAINREMPRDIYYNSYIQTYIQRDVKGMINISDSMAFNKFIRVVAARTGQLLNYSNIAKDVEIDHKTAKSWLSVLEASGLIYLLQPYSNNTTQRLIKTPKVYFLDTGLCSYLTHWPSPEALEAGAMNGEILETYMLVEILKSYWHNGKEAYFYFYRDTDQKEVDLIIEEGDTIYPIEFKKTATPSKTATKNFSVLQKLGKNIGQGAVICLKQTYAPISKNVDAIPIVYI